MSNLRVAAAMAAGLAFASAASGEPGDSVVLTDPVGDTDRGEEEPWLDIVEAELRDDGDTWTFIVVLAADVPPDVVESTSSNRIKNIAWHWGIEADPETDFAGYPLSNGWWLPYEYMPNVFADESGLHGEWIDRRPLKDGHEADVRPMEFTVEGPVITAYVPKEWLDAPGGFLWRFGITAHRGGDYYGNRGFDASDVVGFPFTPSP